MANSKKIFGKIILVGILVFLYLPLLQSTFHFKKYIRELKGAYAENENVGLEKLTWLNGEFQEKKEKYLNSNFGLRNYYVLLNNQIDFSLFKKANADKVVIGKGNFLYESNYIIGYNGENLVRKEILQEKLEKAKDLQDLLYTEGISLQLVFAPGKATFYPEFIPDNWLNKKTINNYELMTKLCIQLQVDYLDLNAWFLKLKNVTPYDLYPKTGIHWSNYGALIAFDSLTKKIELDTKLNLKNICIQNISFSDSLRDPDDDIGKALNLFWPINPLPMPYAKYKWAEDTTYVQPPALFIGDSYFWNLYYEGLTNNVFSNCKFWYYNKTVYPESENERDVSKLDLQAEINNQKVIVILVTDCNIQDAGWGFIESAHELLKSKMSNIVRKKAYIKDLTEEIYRTPAWLDDVKRKAKEKNISTEEMVKLDATYIYETEYNKLEIIELTEENKKRIFNSPEWVKQIKEKAKLKKISFEEMLELDAKYIYVTEQRDELNK